MLRLYNTLSRRKETFKPIVPGQVGMYVCGVTVYDHGHIGHARANVVYDMLYRQLMHLGYAVRYVRNITDIDDKIIRRAAENHEDPAELAIRFTALMHEDEAALGVLRPTMEPRATDTVALMIDLIETLLARDHAYVARSGDVLYSVQSFAGYGRLSGRKLEELRAGERVAIDQDKRDPLDFVLWKSAKPGEPAWDSPWGPGRPGWHIECSAMARRELGITFDIHGGGMDLKFPHHENEIAQSEAANDAPMARFWVHNGLVNSGDEKMSKSLGNFLTIRQALERYSGEDLRLFFLGSHYRSPLGYTEASLASARAGLRRLYTALRGHDPVALGAVVDAAAVARFDAAMNDDLNTVEAVAVLHELARGAQREAQAQPGNDSEQRVRLATLRQLGARLGLLQQDPDTALQASPTAGALDTQAIEALVAERIAARAARDWARSDAIRDALAAQGIQLEDADGQTTWRRD